MFHSSYSSCSTNINGVVFTWRPSLLALAKEEDGTPPARTPGQAEGEDPEKGRSEPDDSLRRKRPSQAEGEDSEDRAGRVPPED